MRYRNFGNTGIKVSEIGFGCWQIGGNGRGNSYGPTDDKTSLEAINRALDLGLNFFETADVYGFGHSEELLGRAFRSKRDRVILATKVGADFYQGQGFQSFTPEYIRFALEKSLSRLQTDYIDVYMLHNPPLKLLARAETFDTLKELKKEGRIRSFGVSVFTPTEGLTALNIGRPDCLEIAYNIFSFKAEEALFPRAHEAGCAIIAREPLANGFLTGKYAQAPHFPAGDYRKNWPLAYVQVRSDAGRQLVFLQKEGRQSLTQGALKFALADRAVSVVIAGMKNIEQVEENLAVVNQEGLDNSQLAAIRNLQARNFFLQG